MKRHHSLFCTRLFSLWLVSPERVGQSYREASNIRVMRLCSNRSSATPGVFLRYVRFISVNGFMWKNLLMPLYLRDRLPPVA
jgi:hypothetical protein